MKSKGLAYLMWFFLGFIGVHKFYLDRVGIGLIYFFTFGLFGVGWIIDLFTLGSQVDRYNSENGFTQNTPPAAATYTGTFEKTILEQILKDQPEDTRLKVGSSFTKISANFEFAVEIDPSQKQAHMDSATDRGFPFVWCNDGNRSTVLYSSCRLSDQMIPRVIDWIISMKRIGQSAMIHYTGRDGEKFVQF